jgi:SAM-dependent methyltransferase
MTVSPFLERLKEHAQATRVLPVSPVPSAPAESQAAIRPNHLAFWQSPVARSCINRRITGDPLLAPETYFARRHGPSMVAPHALSLRASNSKLENALLEAGSCTQLTGLHEDPARVEYANSRVPDPLRGRINFELGDFLTWEAPEPLGAVIARSVLHRQMDLDAVLEKIATVLVPGGLVFVDEFVGPSRSQWTDEQMEAINRLLDRLPAEMLVDLSAEDGRRKGRMGRPDPEQWALANPTEMVCSDAIVPGMDERFERVEVNLYGGAVFHQFFTRIMGNFSDRPELVGVVMEVDALLTDAGALASDYVWGVWRKR